MESYQFLREIVETLERQYPEAFDNAINKILLSSESGQTEKNYLRMLLRQSMVMENKFEICVKLCHPNPEVRKEAVKFVSDKFKTLKEVDQNMIKQYLMDRLLDDDFKVVKEALDIVTSVSNIKKSELKKALKGLSLKCYKKKPEFDKISYRVLKHLCNLCDSNDLDAFILLFPYFVTRSQKEVNSLVKSLDNTNFMKVNGLLDIENLKNISSSEQLYNCFNDSLSKNSDVSIILQLLKSVESYTNIDACYKLSAMITITNITPFETDVNTSIAIIKLFADFKNSSNIRSKAIQWSSSQRKAINISNVLGLDVATKLIDLAQRDKLHVELFLNCLQQIFLKTKIPKLNLGLVNFSSQDDLILFLVSTVKVLFEYYSSHKEYAWQTLSKLSEGLMGKLEFVLNLLASNVESEIRFQENCFRVISDLLSQGSDHYSSFIHLDSVIVLYLLVLLYDPKEKVRSETLNILATLFGNIQDKKDTFSVLIEAILVHKEEIIHDNEEVALIIFNRFSLSKENSDMKRVLLKLNKVICQEDYPIYLRAGLSNLLSLTNDFDIIEDTCQAASNIIDKRNNLSIWESSIVEKTISQIHYSLASKISATTHVWEFMKKALADDKTEIYYGKKKTYPTVLMMNQINNDFFASLKQPIKEMVIDCIVSIATVTRNPTVLPAACRLFKSITLDAHLVKEHLNKMRDVESPNLDGKQKRRRVSMVPTIDILDTLEWRKGVTMLEFMQDETALVNSKDLLPLLFAVLKKCLDFDEQVSVEYPKQLLLTVVYHCCQTFSKTDEISENVFNIELVVQCIRASQNPQTHHHALLVLSKLAGLVPNQVLHHIMAIFTFMGSSVLRYDDAYSFNILTQIINEIIPILTTDSDVVKIGSVLRVFVDALLDVPEHRRMPLYTHLLTKIRAEENLHIFLLLIFESHVVHNSQDKKKNLDNKRCQIASDLCRKFHPDIIVSNFNKIIEYLKSLPEEKESHMNDNTECVTFNIGHYTAKQFRHYKYTIITFISDFLASEELMLLIARLNDDELAAMEQHYTKIIMNILLYIQKTSKTMEKTVEASQIQYWKAVLHHCYNLLNNVNNLLTCEIFLRVTRGLMVHHLPMIQKRAMELLNLKLQHSPEFFSKCSIDDFRHLILQLEKTVEKIESLNYNSIDPEQENIIQTSLYSLLLIVKLLGSKYPEDFKDSLEKIVAIIKSRHSRGKILASMMLCSAELFANLGTYAIHYLPTYMHEILKILKKVRLEGGDSLLLLSVLTAVNKVIDAFPLFISQKLSKLLSEISILLGKYDNEVEDQKILNKLICIKEIIGSKVPLRVLIPAVEDSYNSLLKNNCYRSIGALLDIVKKSLSTKRSEIMPHLSQLTKFFFSSLQFRVDSKSSFSEANTVEEHIIDAFVTLVVKLSESTFKSLYNELYKWANKELKSDKLITFYNLSSKISSHLQDLFVVCANTFFSNASELLNICNTEKDAELYFETEDKNLFLLDSVLKTLQNVFLYSNKTFVTKDRFDIMMQPLVDQLENTLGEDDSVTNRCNNLLIPCIVAFIVAVGDDSLWKQIIYQILLKMRNNSPQIRLRALDCLTAVVKRLGEDFLPLQAETIPFLAELFEDEVEIVEKSCRKAVQEMEKVLGSSLQEHF